jgi:hypothetical protein
MNSFADNGIVQCDACGWIGKRLERIESEAKETRSGMTVVSICCPRCLHDVFRVLPVKRRAARSRRRRNQAHSSL